MDILCGKCGRMPMGNKCTLSIHVSNSALLESTENKLARANCGHPCIGESVLTIEAAERNKALIKEFK